MKRPGIPLLFAAVFICSPVFGGSTEGDGDDLVARSLRMNGDSIIAQMEAARRRGENERWKELNQMLSKQKSNYDYYLKRRGTASSEPGFPEPEHTAPND